MTENDDNAGNVSNARVRPTNLGEWHFADAVVTRSLPTFLSDPKRTEPMRVALTGAFRLAEAALAERRRRWGAGS